MTLQPAPPTHGQTIAVALILDAVIAFGVVFTWLVIRATARPACTCDRREET